MYIVDEKVLPFCSNDTSPTLIGLWLTPFLSVSSKIDLQWTLQLIRSDFVVYIVKPLLFEVR